MRRLETWFDPRPQRHHNIHLSQDWSLVSGCFPVFSAWESQQPPKPIPNPSLTISLAASPITVLSSKRGFWLLLPLSPNNHPDSKCQQKNPRVVNHLVVSFGDVSQRCALHEGLSSTAAASQVESWSAGARPIASSFSFSSSSSSSSSFSSSSLHSTEGSVFSSHHIIIRTSTGLRTTGTTVL